MKFRWDKKYLYTGVTAFVVIACSLLLFVVVSNWNSFKEVLGRIEYVLSPIIIGFVIAFILKPGMNILEKKLFLPMSRRLFRNKPEKAELPARILSMIIMLIVLLFVIFSVIILVIPQLYQSIEKLVSNMDSYIAMVTEWTDKYLAENPEFENAMQGFISRGLGYVAEWLKTGVMTKIETIISSITSGLKSVIMAVVHFCVGVVISVYILLSKEKFGAQSKKVLYSLLKPKTANGLLGAARKTDEMFAGFFVGKLLDSAIIGLICAVFTGIVGTPYFSLVSVIVGITNIIPFFGPYIGAIPCAFIILLENPLQCLIFLIFIVILQLFDGNILGPKILGDRTNLSSFWVVFAILVGGGFFGFAGMVCGVPVFAVIYYFTKIAITRRLGEKGLPIETATYEQLESIDESSNTAVMKQADEIIDEATDK